MPSGIRSLQGAYKDLMEARGFEAETKSAEWILEYVLRHCNDDWTVSELVRVIPFPNGNLRLKKMILLKKISSDVSEGSISGKTLETLNSLKELNRQLCKNYEKNIQDLCYKVSVECTLKHLRAREIDWEGYNEALNKLWCDYVEDTEDIEMSGGFSDRVIEIKKDLFSVASNHMLRDTLLRNYRKEDVLESLCSFLKDAWDEMGPSFLEIVAEDVVNGRYNPSGKGANRVMHSGRMANPSCETRSADAGILQEPGILVDVELQETGSLGDVRLQETRSPDVADKVAENIEDSAATFPPPWADIRPCAAPDSRKERIAQISVQDDLIRNNMTGFDSHDRGHGNVQDSNDVDDQGGPRAEEIHKKCADIRPSAASDSRKERIAQISVQDGLIRNNMTGFDSHDRGHGNMQDCNDVDDQGRPRAEGIHIPYNKGMWTPELIKTIEDLSRSSKELHSRVDDPLPDALNFAEEHLCRRKDFPSIVNLDRNNLSENPTDEVDKSVLAESDQGRDNQVRHTEERGSKHHQSGKSHSESGKFNIMDRNPTAFTSQWGEDSISSPENNSPSASRKVRLPSPSERHVSPLKRPRTVADVQCRRRHTKWSMLEEETLKNEVLKYGKGRWKFILEKNRDIFEERTEVDLKDKWRNIARREGLHAH